VGVRREQYEPEPKEEATMAKAAKRTQRKKAAAIKDLTAKDAKTVKGGSKLMQACATGQHIQKVTL
jgi:translation initiation factor 1 (eIF-1/SUI1)